ncbi:head completion/stabilization protein [Caballeronia sp. LZ001]|uniref:head completion/stabilization protein n=3 Tax=Caballeronia TaxID=1827195 RepID=UPI00285E6880|nr:head completion/stabilization protein [Caballeronia sp. LZ001]MDR5801911.1 head completion/stabilization protein [Caballeronia sp. LZ001]MDR5805276.1 head completion/stabilization protein [Caballeronia sp. LZ001]
MNDFVSVAPISAHAAHDPNPPRVEPILKGDGWYPDIDLRDVRVVLRLDGTVTDARLFDAVVEGIAHAADVLHAWRVKCEASGAADLAATHPRQVAGESVQVRRYRRAVYGWAHALVLERYRGYDTSQSGTRRVDAVALSPDEARRDAYWALGDIVGRRRLTVEAI